MSATKRFIQGCEFEIWEKSIRMVSPVISPVFHSPVKMSSVGAPESLAKSIIDTMNAGIAQYRFLQAESKSYTIGEAV